jgi:hypothetical protein
MSSQFLCTGCTHIISTLNTYVLGVFLSVSILEQPIELPGKTVPGGSIEWQNSLKLQIIWQNRDFLYN